MMRGPFYMYESKEGIKNDEFANCAEEDLLTAANTEALRVLILGKPRSGKTTLSKNLAKRLDL
jgi:tRNA uridine 5-carbamoylmethylation protein Kti12